MKRRVLLLPVTQCGGLAMQRCSKKEVHDDEKEPDWWCTTWGGASGSGGYRGN
jgi:hypothetical protein